MRRLWLALLFVLVGTAVAVAVEATRGSASRGSKPTVFFSVRHEPGAKGHTLTTVAFSVRGDDGNLYLCVVTEDEATQGYSGTALALSQSCDFAVPLR